MDVVVACIRACVHVCMCACVHVYSPWCACVYTYVGIPLGVLVLAAESAVTAGHKDTRGVQGQHLVA